MCLHGGEKGKVQVTGVQLQISRHRTRRKQRRVNRLGLAVLEECRRRTQEESDRNKTNIKVLRKYKNKKTDETMGTMFNREHTSKLFSIQEVLHTPWGLEGECVKLFWDVGMKELSPWKHEDPPPLPEPCHSRVAKRWLPCHQGCCAILLSLRAVTCQTPPT